MVEQLAAPQRRNSNRPLRLGLLGAGMVTTVSYGFLPGLARMAGRAQVVALTSRTRSAAESVAREWNIPIVHNSLADLLSDDSIEAVINATPIPAHAHTNMQIVQAGKHLVTDKPLALDVADAQQIAAAASDAGVVVLSAPAEMLGRDWRETRRLIRSGAIGDVSFARVQSSHNGPAALSWPVDPAPFYQKGQGSLFEMGVYGIDRVTSILGPARRVIAMASLINPHPVVHGGPFSGVVIDATVDDTVLITLEFDSGALATIDCCFTVAATRSAPMEIYGIDGTLIVQRPGALFSPNGPRIELLRGHPRQAESIGEAFGVNDSAAFDRAEILQRAVLIDHLVDCLDEGTPPEVGADRAIHVLEIMVAAERSASDGHAVELQTTFSSDY